MHFEPNLYLMWPLPASVLSYLLFSDLSFCGRQQKHSTHELALELVSGAVFLVQPALLFEPEPVPRLPGPAAGRKGPKIGQKPKTGFTILSSHMSQTPVSHKGTDPETGRQSNEQHRAAKENPCERRRLVDPGPT
jgi:hypothetical protein